MPIPRALIAAVLLVLAHASLHAATLPALNSTWKYKTGTSEASTPDTTAWRAITFNDGAWTSGAAPFRQNTGTGGTVLAIQNSYSCIFMRQTFTLSAGDLAAIPQLMLNIDYDDGFIVWINGVEVERRYAPKTVTFNAIAAAHHDSGVPELFALPNPANYLVAGTNVIAVQAFNVTFSSNDFMINPELLASQGKVGDTQFSFKRGIYNAAFDLAITCATAGTLIRYTIDGSKPSPTQGTQYSGPIPINTTTILRAIAYKAGMAPSNVDTQTYIFPSSVKNQTRPPSYPTIWGNGSAGDYDMDTKVVNSPTYANRIEGALTDIPSVSIVMSFADSFGPNGIYLNTTLEGHEWERPCSFELINPDGTPGFQINCGASISGGFSRTPIQPGTGTQKHSFRMTFKDFWGPTKLESNFFGPGSNTSFDSVILRCHYNNAWTQQDAAQRLRAQYVTDQFIRDTHNLTGHAAAHGTFHHLYVNGMYWGLYLDHERPDGAFAAAYYGGTKTDWDAVNSGTPTDGDLVAFNSMWSVVNSMATSPGPAQNAQYQSLKQYCDIDDLIDYLIVNQYGGNIDWDNGHNWYGARKREPGAGFKFFCWDAEHCLELLTHNAVIIDNTSFQGPTGIFQKLRFNPDFRIRFADHVHKHLTRNGCLTPSAAAARYKALVDRIDKAVIGESARWGDMRLVTSAYTRDVEWLNERTRLLGNPVTIPPASGSYFADRTNTVLNQYRTPQTAANQDINSLYPAFEPPLFSVESGNIPAGGLTLELTNPPGNPTANFVMYYTLDGSDPRVPDSVNGPGGAINASAQNGGLNKTLTINTTTTVKARFRQANFTWSALHEGTYVGSQNLGALKITEINYHPIPMPPGTQPEEKFEFIELKNTGQQTLNLTDVKLFGKASNPTPLYSFPTNATLAAGKFLVLVFDQTQFRARYPLATYPNAVIGGVISAKLDNGGQILALKDSGGAAIFTADYSDEAPWPAGADGNGFSVVPIDPNINADPNNALNWRNSANAGGSPGTDDPLPPPIPLVVINEVLSNSTAPQVDVIELFNPSAQPADIGNWYLTDDHGDPKKYKIPAGTIVPAEGYLSINETEFGLSFSLSSHGEQAYLYSADAAGNLTGYSDGFQFSDSETNVTFGRYVISTGAVKYPAQISMTSGIVNSGPKVGPVVITKMMYAPTAAQDEFMEIKNITAGAVSLFDAGIPANTWRINGLDFNFPLNTTLPPGGIAIITAIDPIAFAAKYTLPPGAQVFGPYTGNLQDNGENVELQKPDVPYVNGDNLTVVPYVTVDALDYSSALPWPPSAAGSGYTLERINPVAFGDDPINWRAGGIYGTPANQAPAFVEVSPLPISIDEDGSPVPFSLTLNASDANNDPLTWSISAPAAHGTATVSGTGTSKVIGYEPVLNYNGSDSFTVSIADGFGGTAALIMNVTIRPRNDAPINSTPPSINGLTQVGATFTADNGGWNDSTDVAPGTISYAYQWQRADDTSGTNLVDIGGASAGTYVLTAADMHKFLRIRVTASDDGEGLPASQSAVAFSAYVPMGNQMPVFVEASPQPVAMDEDAAPAPFALTLSATDADNDTLTWSIFTQATHGVALAGGTGGSKIIEYLPAENYNGTDSFVVRIADGFGATADLTVNVTINPRNDAPVNMSAPSIAGTLSIGSALTALNGDWNDSADVAPGTIGFSYQWQRADSALGDGLSDIAGAAAGTYVLDGADLTKFLRVKVTATDDGEGLPAAQSSSAFSAFVEIAIGPPATLTISGGSNQSAPVNTVVAVAPAVIVKDSRGNPVADGTIVTFAVASGGGSITGEVATTLSGVAAVGSWKLGSTPGVNTLTVTSGAAPAVTFTATGVLIPAVFDSAPTAAPNPATVGQQIAFAAAASSPSGAPLTYAWNFGDGTSGASASVSHAYQLSGNYNASVTVTDGVTPISAALAIVINPASALVGSGNDSDGDGFSDMFEIQLAADPLDPANTPTGQPASVASIKGLSVSKAAIKLNFAANGKDSITFSGLLNIPAGFQAANSKIILDAGGVTKTLVLTGKGSAKSGNDSVKIAIKSKKGVVLEQAAKFTALFKNGTFAQALATSGLTNADAKNAPKTLPVTILLNGSVLQKPQPLSYTAKKGKTGAAKQR